MMHRWTQWRERASGQSHIRQCHTKHMQLIWPKQSSKFSTSRSAGATLWKSMLSAPLGTSPRKLQWPTRSVGSRCPGHWWPQPRNGRKRSFSKTSASTGPSTTGAMLGQWSIQSKAADLMKRAHVQSMSQHWHGIGGHSGKTLTYNCTAVWCEMHTCPFILAQRRCLARQGCRSCPHCAHLH